MTIADGWAPGAVEVRDAVSPWALGAFAAMIDAPAPVGDLVPPLWHWFAFLDHPAGAELGADGHPADGHFLPPIPDRRRMFAGGRVHVREPLRVGVAVVRRSSLVSATVKRGRSGEMLFVTVRHEFGPPATRAAVAVVEEQDIVYRSQASGAAARPAAPDSAPASDSAPAPGSAPASDSPHVAGSAAAPGGSRAPEGGHDSRTAAPWSLTLRPDEALLFRFSALTYNAHRIHYDQAYVTGVEGYPGLVVHGPLLALLLLELPRRHAPQRPVTRFEYRLERPAFAGTPITARRDGDGALVAGVPGRPPSIRGSIDLG